MLREDRTVDVERTRELVDAARPLEVTFHRAFDHTRDLLRALEDILETGATRILSSGGAPGAPEGAATLRELVAAATGRVIIMPGAGLHAANIATVAAQTGAREFHSGLGTVLPYGSSNLSKFESEIHTMKRCLNAHSLAS
jgi:copper homeostasis protein